MILAYRNDTSIMQLFSPSQKCGLVFYFMCQRLRCVLNDAFGSHSDDAEQINVPFSFLKTPRDGTIRSLLATLPPRHGIACHDYDQVVYCLTEVSKFPCASHVDLGKIYRRAGGQLGCLSSNWLF